MKDNHFLIVVPAFNCEKWIEQCLKSVLHQTYKNYRIVFIDDMSTDKTYEKANNLIGTTHICLQNHSKAYALANIVSAIELAEPNDNDIILTLDGDDWLFDDNVLSYLNKFYQDNDCWLTYGSYVEYPNGIRGKFAKQISHQTIINKSYRQEEWCSSHLRTFKYGLWKHINLNDMKNKEDQFYDMTWDLSFMFPMLEMTGKRAKYIEKILYVYNRDNPINDDKVNHQKQLNYEKEIRNKKKYQLLENL